MASAVAPAAVVAVTTQEEVGYRAVVNDVAVELALRVAVGIERLRHRHDFTHDHVGRQMSVGSSDEGRGGMATAAVEVNDLSQRVNARVRAAGEFQPLEAIHRLEFCLKNFGKCLYARSARVNERAVNVEQSQSNHPRAS